MENDKYVTSLLELAQLISYVCDPETYELLYVSKPAMDVFGLTSHEQYKGMTCHKLMHGSDTPCANCNNCKLEEGKRHQWEFFNENIGRWFDITDTITTLNGRRCKVSMSREISARRDTNTPLPENASTEDVLFRCLHVLATEKDLQKAVNIFLSYVGRYYQAKRVHILELDPEAKAYKSTFEWYSEEDEGWNSTGLQLIPTYIVEGILANLPEGGCITIDPMSFAFSSEHTLTLTDSHKCLVTPLIRNGIVVGILGISDPQRDDTYMGLLTSVSEFILAELENRRLIQELQHLSYTDILTEVGNRNSYNSIIANYQTNPPEKLGIIDLSLNGLKNINDALGQDRGDEFIARTAALIREYAQGDIYRISGDEFIVLSPNMEHDPFVTTVTNLIEAFHKEPEFSVSIGYEWDSGAELEEQLRRAHAWMQSRKQHFYQLEFALGRSLDNSAEDLLRDINDGRFEVWYQPQVDLKTGTIIGAEALVRKRGENGALIPPNQFIPDYENRNIISHLDLFVLETAIMTVRQLRNLGLAELPISVNFSRATLLVPDFSALFHQLCSCHNVSPRNITLEVTETISTLGRDTLQELLAYIHNSGLCLSLDDFGSKYANLAILNDIAFDEIKFDKTLVDDLCQNPRSQVILGELIRMCRKLQRNTRIVVEGIENEDQAAILRDHDSICAQGFYFYRPMPLEDLLKLLTEQAASPTPIFYAARERKDSFTTFKQLKQQEREELFLSMIRNGNNLCGYRIDRRQGVFSSEYAARYKMPEVVDNIPDLAVQAGLVAPQSRADWYEMFDEIHRGSLGGSRKIFMRNSNGVYDRYWMRYSSLRSDDNQAYISLITFDNIADEYEMNRLQSHSINALLQSAERSFTDVLSYNLTQKTCRIIRYSGSLSDIAGSSEHPLDEMIPIFISNVVPEDRSNLKHFLSHDVLSKAFLEDNATSLDTTYRRYNKVGKPVWYQSSVARQQNDIDDDVLLVVTSRNIDAQKAEEARLTNELWLQSEEIRVTTGKLGRVIFYYDIPKKTLHVPDDYARMHNMPRTIPNYPDCITLNFRTELPKTYGIIRRFYDSIQRGEAFGNCELTFTDKDNPKKWQRWEFATVFDRSGKPSRAIIFVEDITEQHIQADEMKRLRSAEQFSQIITQHSDRIVYFFDAKKNRLRPWDDIAKARKPRSASSDPVQALLKCEHVTAGSTDALREMFLDIQKGVSQGALKLQTLSIDKITRWYDIRFSTIFDEDSDPVSAIISLKDITEQYELELSYIRQLQAMQNSEAHIGSIEVDLNTGIIETQTGRAIPPEIVAAGNSMSSIAEYMLSMRIIDEVDRIEAKKFFSTAYLNDQYKLGTRRMERTWQFIFHNGAPGWILIEVDLVMDPYSQHSKAFFHLTDVTKEKNEQMAMLMRSEQDGMTGLLNRTTTEDRVRAILNHSTDRGILILLDLDDLKLINDLFGHSEGDRAIRNIAQALKDHFREGDIIGRIGGDEFLIYLPGAATNQDAISASVSNLLRKLTRMPVGENNERRLHCSLGAAAQLSGDTFDSLYKRADVALYSVKRSGKNNYAFYVPAMEDENHHFQSQRLLSQRSSKKANITELQYLLSALTDLYEAVVAFNLTTRDYFLLEEDKEGIFSILPSYGTMKDFVDTTRMGIHPDDMADYLDWLTGDALLQAYERGERSVRYHCRFYYNGAFRWIEIAIVFYINEEGDLCDFTLLRFANERTQDLDQLSVTKALELASNPDFDSIALIDVMTGRYARFDHNADKNNETHVRKSYDDAVKTVSNLIPNKPERDLYYANANLSTVLTRIAANNGTYSFSYNLPTGHYEATFEWMDPSHTQLFLTSRKLDETES